MILSVYIYIAELELVKVIMEEGKKMGTKDFFIGGEGNIKLKLEGGVLTALIGMGSVGLNAEEAVRTWLPMRKNFAGNSFSRNSTARLRVHGRVVTR